MKRNPGKPGCTRIGCFILLMAFSLQAVAQLRPSSVNPRAEALKFRLLTLRNENGKIPPDAWMKAAAQRKRMRSIPGVWPTPRETNSLTQTKATQGQPKAASLQRSAWTWLGPENIGGRIRSILVHPTTPNTMWLGGVDGGVWKTLNAGESWFPLDDFMASLAVSCMVMDPTDPDVIYAGTGEGFGSDGIQGAGIFKTTDGGATWPQLSSTATTNFLFVNRLAISPADHQTLLAGTSEGIFLSTDGGASWTQTFIKRTFDLAFNPKDASECIASGFNFVSFSTDGGLTWPDSTGITNGRRIEIAYAPSFPSIVYASADKNFGELYRSTDGGQTFSLRNTGNNYFREDTTPPFSQGGYDNCLWVDPTNPHLLVVGGLDLWRSSDGGATLTDIGGYVGGVHPDQHIIIQHPSFNGTSVKSIFVGNDGGIYKADDVYSVFRLFGWADLNQHLGITQFWGGAGNASSGTIIGGSQDNGTLRYTPDGGPSGWTEMHGGDGAFCAADPTDPNYFYGEQFNLQIFRSTDGGGSAGDIYAGIVDRGFAVSPFILDPNNPNTMLAGGSNLWRSVNVKAGWPAAPAWSIIKPGLASRFSINAIAVAPGNSDLIWVAHSNGEIYMTANGTAMTPAWFRKDPATTDWPQQRGCKRLAIDPNHWSTVYVTFGGFQPGNVWQTSDGGTTWTNISHNLPEAPVNSIVVNPHLSNWLYVGTEVGVFASSDGGASWSPSNDGPANVNVSELFWMDDTLIAATHGRGMYSIQPIIWVEYNPACPNFCGDGRFENPFNNLSLARSFVSPGGTIFFKPGTSGNCGPGQDCFPMTISEALTLETFGGPVTIGR